MADQIQKLSHEPHVFRVSLSFRTTGTTALIVVSEDASIVYIMDADAQWINEFKSGEARIYVQGHYDLLDNNIYLGARVPDPMDW